MNINSAIKHFFVENDFDKLAEKISVVRNDGVVVFSNSTDFTESNSIGALVGGLWQAAEALNSIVSRDSDIFEFRMSFDTSEKGIYVLPLKIKIATYYLCAIYKDINNPAVLKKNLRNLRDNLYFYLKNSVTENKSVQNDYLFTNISDEEMDKLFKFAEI